MAESTAKDKMTHPAYRSIKKHECEITFESGKIGLLAGNEGRKGFESSYLPSYYDIHLNANSSIVINTERERSVMVFTLLGDVYIGDQLISEKTAAKLTEGDYVTIKAGDENAQVLFVSSKKLGEPVAWGGPIVMNTREELQKAFDDLEQGTFLKEKIFY